MYKRSKYTCFLILFKTVRAESKKNNSALIFTWKWGSPRCWGNPLGEVKKNRVYMQSHNAAVPGCTFRRLFNGRQARKQKTWLTFTDVLWRAMLFYSLSCCHLSVLWLSVCTFNEYEGLRQRQVIGNLARIWCKSDETDPKPGGLNIVSRKVIAVKPPGFAAD